MSDLFNPLEFGFKDLGKNNYGHSYENEFVVIRRIEGYLKIKKELKWFYITDKISESDLWKIKYKDDSNFIYVGLISNKNFALELFSNLDVISKDVVSQLKRDFVLKNLLK